MEQKENITHKVTMTVELTVEAPENKTQKDVEDFSYRLFETFLDNEYGAHGYRIQDFNIEMN